MFNEICDWIRNLGLGPPWVMNQNYFPGFLPIEDSADTKVPVRILVVLQNTPGAVWGEMPDQADKPIQLWNRAEDYWTAQADAMELYNAIHGVLDGSWMQIGTGTQYLAMSIDAMGTPAPIENPGPRGFVWSGNYMFRMEQASGSCE